MHPDRNFGNVNDSGAKFAEVSSAYEILSDPQERAWYDSHRESILNGDNHYATDEDHEHSAHLTSVADIVGLMGGFNSGVPFTDATNGFYGILQEFFTSLAREEIQACERDDLEHVEYPDFGKAGDSYEDVAKPFYRVWTNFSTRKTFSWRDMYRASDAPDRATRRLAEKENKKLRDEGIREFNDAVRSLAAFARKRDPRYTPNSQSEADRQKVLRDAAAAQAARSKASRKAKLRSEHIIPEWARSESQKPEEEGTFSDSEESVVEHIECVVCEKIFKSEKQYEAHEKSKKHIKAVQKLKREMRRENVDLNLALSDASESGSITPAGDLANLALSDHSPASQSSSVSRKPSTATKESEIEEEKAQDQDSEAPETETESQSEASNDEYTSREEIESRLAAFVPGETWETSTATPLADHQEKEHIHKVGKAKAKRAKKAAQLEKNQVDSSSVSLYSSVLRKLTNVLHIALVCYL